tara:strand:- start:3049 stop:3336 length:288 start_codon:yes stop_codon:yes gene_type:complete
VHSFLYYQLNESIISDSHFDLICKDLSSFIKKNSHINFLPYEEILKNSLSNDASGFKIRKFPAEIISAALHLLYQHKYRESLTFENFLARFGYRL